MAWARKTSSRPESRAVQPVAGSDQVRTRRAHRPAGTPGAGSKHRRRHRQLPLQLIRRPRPLRRRARRFQDRAWRGARLADSNRILLGMARRYGSTHCSKALQRVRALICFPQISVVVGETAMNLLSAAVRPLVLVWRREPVAIQALIIAFVNLLF